MEAFVGVLLMCVIPAGLALAAWKPKIVKGSKIAMFWGLIFYGILSCAKSVLGEGNLTLVESFHDIEVATYLHYGIPLLVIAIILSLGLKYISVKNEISSFIEVLDSIWLFGLLFLYIFTGRISNWMYLGVGLISILATIGVLVFYKGDIQFHSSGSGKARIKAAVPVVLFWVVSSILYFPSELFLTNVSEFPMRYAVFCGILMAQGIITLIVYVLLSAYFFSEVLFEAFYTGLFAVTFMGYIQTLFFNGRLHSLDGSSQEWGMGKIGINVAIWVTVICLICLFKWKQKEKAGTAYRVICICICLMQAVMTFNLIFSTKDINKDDSVLTREGSLEIHEKNNVLVFILDFFDSQIIDQIVGQEEDFLTPLYDFTYYPNTTSRYAFTNESIPYLLTGVEAKDLVQFSLFQYTEYAFDNSTFLSDIAREGYEVGIYTEAHYLGENVKDIVSNYSEDAEKSYYIADTISLMGQSSKYKMAPFALKKFYWYDSSDIGKLAIKKNAYSTIDDLALYYDLVQNGLKIDANKEGEGVFRFYHLYGAHAPYNMTEELEELDGADKRSARDKMLSQAKGSLKIVYEYIRQLKDLGLYENATIIITSDHGQNYLLDAERVKQAEELNLKETSNPILFVKRAGQGDGSGLVVSTAPLSHTDLHATIIEAVGGNASSYGKTIDDFHEGEERERKFLYGRADIPYREFTIRGDVRDIRNWQLTYNEE